MSKSKKSQAQDYDGQTFVAKSRKAIAALGELCRDHNLTIGRCNLSIDGIHFELIAAWPVRVEIRAPIKERILKALVANLNRQSQEPREGSPFVDTDDARDAIIDGHVNLEMLAEGIAKSL